MKGIQNAEGHAVLKVFENGEGKKQKNSIVVRTVGKKKLITGGRGKKNLVT